MRECPVKNLLFVAIIAAVLSVPACSSGTESRQSSDKVARAVEQK